YLHRHQGPGIRCLLEGGIRIDTGGRSTSYGPGGAWYESGPEPVFAQAAPDRPSRFIRVMVLPRALLGKSSIQYVNEEDKNKPRTLKTTRIKLTTPINTRASRITSSSIQLLALIAAEPDLTPEEFRVGLRGRCPRGNPR